MLWYCFDFRVPFLGKLLACPHSSETGHTYDYFLGHHSPKYACTVEDCPQGMHKDLMYIPLKGTRRGLASRGKVLF